MTTQELEELDNKNDWKTYTGEMTLGNGSFYVFCKVTDKCGNVSYAGTDGIVIYQNSQVLTETYFIYRRIRRIMKL